MKHVRRRRFIETLIGTGTAIVYPTRGWASERFKNFSDLDTHNFAVTRISDSVFAVRGKPETGIPTNSSIIVGDRGVAVVDTHQRPSFDEEMRGIVRRITDLPIRYLINTHWHQDHTLGNQVFEKDATIVGHARTRSEMLDRVVRSLDLQRRVLPEEVKEARLALEARKQAGAPSEELRQLELSIALEDAYVRELATLRVVPPVQTFDESLQIDIADQPVLLRFLGPAHTRGDIVVHLPAERVIVLGDIVTAGQPFMRRADAVPSQWAPTLEKVLALDWNRAVIGHGWVDNPRARTEILVSYLHDLVNTTRQAIESGLPEDAIPKAVRAKLLERHAGHFPYFFDSVLENVVRTQEELGSAR